MEVDLGNKHVLIEANEFKGRKQFQVFEMFQPNHDGVWVRAKGVTVPLEEAPKMINAMLQVLAEAAPEVVAK